MSYYKRGNLSKNSTETATWKLVPDLFAVAKNSAQTLIKNKIFEASYLYVLAKLSKYVQISMQTSLDSFLQGLELVSRSHFS